MARSRMWLIALALIVVAMPGVAQAKLKTKIVFTNAASSGYSTHWSLDTTSVAAPLARARLMYYKPSTGKWVGYGRRPVKVTRGSSLWGFYTVTNTRTDSKGYFKFTLRHQQDYKATYAGSATSRSTSKSTRRTDHIDTRRLSQTITTSTVDATHTRIAVVAEFNYNPFITRKEVSVATYVNLGDPEADGSYVGAYWTEDWLWEAPGVTRSECAFVIPTALMESQPLVVVVGLDYLGFSDPHIDTDYIP